jgi:hypothetical protein
VTARLRLIELRVQPVIVSDDGEELTFLDVAPMTVRAADLDDFPAALRAQLAAQQPQDDPKDEDQ